MNCFCGNSLKYPNLETKTCSVGCSGNLADYCGDSTGQFYNVYKGKVKLIMYKSGTKWFTVNWLKPWIWLMLKMYKSIYKNTNENVNWSQRQSFKGMFHGPVTH